MKQGVLQKYGKQLPLSDLTPALTLGEGDTPLVRSKSIGSLIGCEELYFKLEGCNPTGSFKDRGMVVAVAKALEEKSTSIACASTGNTSASAAAYGARCGLPTTVLVPKDNVAQGKLAQAVAYGAKIMVINGNFDHALRLVRDLTEKHPIVLVNSLNPYRLQGQKTAAFEIVDDIGDAPDYLFVPVGNAGNITAYWLGFEEAVELQWSTVKPRLMGFQAAGASPIVQGKPVLEPETIASAIRVGNPASWTSALRATNESGGQIYSVTDNEIIEAYKMMARLEGVFCEPASAASVAGLLKLVSQGLDLKNNRAVCVITGTGLKDPELATSMELVGLEEHPAELTALEKALTLT